MSFAIFSGLGKKSPSLGEISAGLGKCGRMGEEEINMVRQNAGVCSLTLHWGGNSYAWIR